MFLKIRKRTQEEWLLLYILVMPFLFFVLKDVLQLPSAIKYTLDIIWLFLALAMPIVKAKLPNKQARNLMGIAAALLVISFVGFVLERQSFLYYLWGLRNNARFFVFFAACVVFLRKQTATDCMKLLDKIFWINLAVSLYQFAFMGKKQDYLGGVFGVSKGCNSYTNIFLVIVVSWHIVQYMSRKESFKGLMFYCLPSLVLAALTELKFFYGEFLAILVLAMLITRFSIRKVWILLGGAAAFVVGAIVLNAVFSGLFSKWFNLTTIWNSLTTKTGYTNTNDMNRLTVFPIAWHNHLNTGLQKLLGLGLGNCDMAEGYDFLTTPFFQIYQYTNYTWFSSAMMMLEMGVLGYAVYNWFFIKLFFAARQRLKNQSGEPAFCQLAMIAAALCPLIIIYNSSLRTEAAYLMYFVLALPFIRSTPSTIEAQSNQKEAAIHEDPQEEHAQG